MEAKGGDFIINANKSRAAAGHHEASIAAAFQTSEAKLITGKTEL